MIGLPKLRSTIPLLVSFILGIAITLIIKPQQSTPFLQEIRNPQKYQFINPLLECEQASTADNNLNPLRDQVRKLIDTLTTNPQINHISLYYRDLNNGPWFGINERENFSPASLVKVPLMMAYYKQAELNPDILNQTIINKPIPTQNQNITPQVTLVPNQQYPIDELINRMIIYSDNVAYDLLLENIDNRLLVQTFTDLGINISQGFTNPSGNILSVKDYASFFRILFNSSYLNKTMSEKALKLLNQVEFDKALVAGLPSTITISHKFGEREFLATGEKQLHDCGIIYLPNKPYLLCVMTRGKDISLLANAISQISSLIYRQLL